MPSIRTVFAGTPDFAVPPLEALLKRHDIELVAVYTQPDRPAGRGRKLHESPVKQVARAAGITVCQPPTLRDTAAASAYAALDVGLLVVAAYGLMLPASFIDPPITALNVHASLLPRWRGAAPIQRALMAGDETSGIAIMRVVERLDAGPVWLTRACTIDPRETGGTLHDRLAALGAEALDAALDAWQAGRHGETQQDEARVTYAHKLAHEDRLIDWSRPAAVLARQVRALSPSPGALASLGRLDVKLLFATAQHRAANAAPGAVLGLTDAGLAVATGEGTLLIEELQPAGKQRMSAAAFMNGYGAQL